MRMKTKGMLKFALPVAAALVALAAWAHQGLRTRSLSNSVVRVAARKGVDGGRKLFGYSEYGWRVIEHLTQRIGARAEQMSGPYSMQPQSLSKSGVEILPAVFWLPSITNDYTPVEQPLAMATVELSTTRDRTWKFDAANPTRWPKLRVAHVAGVLDTRADFERWAGRNQVKAKIVDFDDVKPAIEAVRKGDCDMLLFATCATPEGFSRLAEIRVRPTYIAVRKDLKLLHAALSREMQDVKMNDQHWLDDTWKACFGSPLPEGRIRVGVCFEPGLFERGQNGEVRGYVAEYVNRVAHINNWTIDYVLCTYNEALKGLEQDKIDVFGGVTYLNTRTKMFNYSRFSAGIYQYYIYSSILPPLTRETASQWQRAHIVAGPGEESLLRLEKHLSRYGIRASLTECPTTQAAIETYQSGAADALFAVAYGDAKAEEVVSTLTPVPWFFCTPFGRDDLRQELDVSLVRIQSQYPGFQELTRLSHTSDSVRNDLGLSKRETDWLKSRLLDRTPVRVEMSPNVLLWKEYDHSDRSLTGVLEKFLDKLEERTGLTFEVLPPVNQAVARTRYLRGEADLWASYMADLADLPTSGRRKVIFSNPTVVPIHRDLPYPKPGVTRFALVETDSTRRDALSRLGYGKDLVLCRNEEECYEAIVDHRADATLAAPRVALVLMRRLNALDDIEIRNLPEFSFLEDVSFEFSPKIDPMLAAVLDKAMESISPVETEQMLRDTLYARVGRTRFTPVQFMTMAAALIIVVLVICVIGAVAIAIRAHRRTDAAVAAEKTKTRFLSTISHEIRTPLNVLVGYSDFLNQPNITKDQIREYTDGIRLSGQVLLSLINDVLDLSKLEAGKMDLSGQCNLPDLFAVLRVMFAGMARKKGLGFEMYLQPGLPVVGISAQRLRQILFNLISNAVKYTERGKVRAEAVGVIAPSGDYMNLTLRVSDTGIGISKERLAIVFDPFEQDMSTRGGKVFEGTGLGLPIVKRLVDAAGGSVSCESSPGVGSVFTVFLPSVKVIHPSEETLNKEAQELRASAMLGAGETKANELDYESLKVLIVDDIALNLRVFSIYLRKLGIQHVCQALSGAEALDVVRESHPDVVFTDMWMPGMTGADLAAEIRDEDGSKNKTFLVAVTADADSAATFNLESFDVIMTKPVTEEKVIRALNALSSHQGGGGGYIMV
jgi:signal transduction histidine kinase/ABC-type amino acid transport substrate-binding protein/ActR/RegA family two-component response regulator